MSRIPLIEPENASPEVREIYRKYEADGFPIFNVMKMFANKADFVAGLYVFTHGLYTDAKLSPRYRELAYLRPTFCKALTKTRKVGQGEVEGSGLRVVFRASEGGHEDVEKRS